MPKALNMSLAVTADTTKARQQLMDLQSTLSQISMNSANLKVNINTKDIQAASKAVLELQSHLAQATNPQTGTLDFTKLNNSIKNSGKTLQEYGQQLVSLGPDGKQAFSKLAASVAQSEIPIKRISGMLGQMGTVLGNTIRWQAASSIIHGMMGTVQQAFGYAKALNASLNRIQLVTSMSNTQMANFAENANKAAKALSTTTTAYTDAALIYYQQGIRDQREINERTSATIKMANVTGQSAQKVSDQMTAIWNNFAKGGTNLEYYADVITALGAATASSSEEISRGLEKFASIADTVGLSYENATAALATITATTRQSADTVGTGLRTLFSRLQSVSLGETLEDGVNLTKYSKALETVGVQVLDTTGELRSMDDILEDLGKRWDKISDSQKVALAQTVGGVRQYTTLMALMDNFDFYKENVGIATNSAGTLNKQQEIFEQSWGAAAQRVKASMESIFSNLIDDKFFTNLTSGFAKFLDIINNIITGVGGVKGILLGLGGVMTKVFNQQATMGVYNFATGIRNMFRTPQQQARDREKFLLDATSIYAQRTIKENKDGSLDLSGLGRKEQTMVQGFYNQLSAERRFMETERYMTPEQRFTATLAMDDARRSNDQLQLIQERNAQITKDRRALEVKNNFRFSSGQGNNKIALNKYVTKMNLSQKALSEIDQLEKGNITEKELSTITKQLINGVSPQAYDQMRERIGSRLDLQGHRERLVSSLTAAQWSRDDIKDYVNLLEQQAQGKLDEQDAQRLNDFNNKRRQDAVNATSKGIKAANGVVNIGGGLMSGLAAQQGLQSLGDTFNQVKTGAIDTGQAIQQGLGGVAQLGFNGARAWMQFNQVMGPVAATAMTIGTIALPAIIKGIDQLVTTPKEVLENLHKNTEQAENIAQEAKTAYTDLMNSFSTHNSLLDQLDKLKQGTIEFQKALLDANDAAYKLINDNNLSEEDWYIDKHGAVQIKEETQQRLQEEALEKQRTTQAEAYMAKSLEQTATIKFQNDEVQKIYQSIQDEYNKNLNKELKQWENDYLQPKGQITALSSAIKNGSIARYINGRSQEVVLQQLSQESGNDYAIEERLGFSPYLMERYYEYLSERDKKQSQLNSELQYDYSSLETYYNKNKDKLYGIQDYTQFQQEVISGSFQQNQLVRSGFASQNKIALTNALLAASGESKLSDIDDLIATAVSQSPEFLNSAYTNATTLQNVERSKKWWEYVGTNPQVVAGAALAGAITKDMSAYNRLTSTTVKEETLDLTKELDLLNTNELKKKYKELGVTDEDIKALEESNEYKAAVNEGADAQRQFWKDQIITKSYLQEQVKAEQELKTELKKLDGGKVWKDLNNYTKLSGKEFSEMINNAYKSLQSVNGENAEYIRAVGQGIIEEAKEQKTKVNSEFIQIARDAGIENIDALSQSLQNASIETVMKMNSVNQRFFEGFGENAREWTTQKMIKANGEIDTSILNAFDSFEFSGSKIQDLLNIKSGKSSLSTIEGLADEGFIALRAAAGGDKGLFEELYDSEGFEDSLKTLQKELKKTGQIGAKSIMDLGEQLGVVSDFLDVSTTNAQGLADVLTAIEIGDLTMDQVTNSLLAALSISGQIKDNLASSFSFIDTFQQERSTQDIGKFASQLVKSIDSGFASGQLFDPQTLQAWGTIFGNDSLAEYRKLLIDATDNNQTPEEISKLFNERFEAENKALDSITKYGDLTGLYDYYANLRGPLEGKNSLFSYDTNTNQIKVNPEVYNSGQYNTQEEFIQGLIDNYDISETIATMLANEMGAKMPHLNQHWAEGAVQEGALRLTQEEKVNDKGETELVDRNLIFGDEVKAFLNNNADIIKSTDQAGLQAILAPLLGNNNLDFSKINGIGENGSLTNIDMNQLIAQVIAQGALNTGGKIIDFASNFDFSNQDQLKQQLGTDTYNEIFGDAFGKTRQRINDLPTGVPEADRYKQVQIIDIDEMTKGYKALGKTATEAGGLIREAFGDDAEQGVKVLASSYKDLNGQTQKLLSTDDDFKKYWETAKSEGKNYYDAFAEWSEQRKSEIEEEVATMEAAKPITQGIIDALTGENGIAKDFAKEMVGAFTDVSINFDADGTAAAQLTGFKNQIDAIQQAASNIKLEPIYQTIILKYTNKKGEEVEFPASGHNNAFAGGKHKGNDYTGPAITGELGPEARIDELGDGSIAVGMLGTKGREETYVYGKNTHIYTAAQTKYMQEHGMLPRFPDGENNTGTSVSTGIFERGSNASGDNVKTSKWEPERYHLITRQLKDLQREYDRLSKIKDNAYGTNKLEAIQAEIDATNELIEGQKHLIQETEDYIKIDVERLKGLLEANEFQIDANGNLENFEELQQKYRKAAEEDKDEHAQDVWKALNQYEETLDKLNEANTQMQDLLYQEMELRLEKITTKAELKIDFDEREIKLLDHYIKRIDDNIYHTAEVLALTEQKLGHINQKIEDTKVGIAGLFEELSDSEGNLIRKDDGSAYTLEEWLALSKGQRDLLDINDNFGKQLEDYMDNILDYIEELEEFKTKGVEEFGEAFDELNENVRSSIDLFDHYNQLLSSLKNITDLQGVKLSAEMRATMKAIDQAMLNNTQNNIDAERENYRRLTTQVADLRQKIAETQDETLKKAWEEQLKTAEEELRTSEQNMLKLWETGLQQAKDMFESSLEEAATNYEEIISGMYGTTDELQKAWDQQKKNDEFYVKDYEKYYQISKLQRSITKDLDAAARSGNRQNQGLKKLFDELNAAREDGVELSAYDLDIFEKRYEYEKALMELEDARNNKSEVRLQRDASGNWGYVYTSSADEDDLIAKQQAVDDKFYELQKATQERVAALSDDMISEITGVGRRLQELRSSGASQETIDKYLEQERKYLENYREGLAKALADAGMTEEEARLRYGNEGFDILDQFGETLLSAITGGNETLDEFFARVGMAMDGTNDEMAKAADDYQGQMNEINKWFNESGEDLAKVIKGFAAVIDAESGENLIDSKEQIQNAKDTFDEILKVATDFEKEFIKIYQPIIDENEKLVADLLYALHALNREEYEGPGYDDGSGQRITDIIKSVETLPSEDEKGDGSNIWKPTGTYKNCGSKGHQQIFENQQGQKVASGPILPHGPWTTIGGGVHRICVCGYKEQLIFPVGIEPFASGGYTGDWGTEGRMAMLHEKELVLNKNDTKNFLDATNILRTIDLQTNLYSKGLGSIITPWIDDMKSQVLEQDVHIEANFPNVQDRHEIEAAFDNLINKASQYANRKNMSSMTFQDMYTSKF